MSKYSQHILATPECIYHKRQDSWTW